MRLKSIGLTISCLFLVSQLFAQTVKGPTLLSLNLKDAVKSFTQIDHSVTGNIPELIFSDTLAYQAYEFGQDGKIQSKFVLPYPTLIPEKVIYDSMGYVHIKIPNAGDTIFYINEYWNGLLMKKEEDTLIVGSRPFWRFGYGSDGSRSFETNYDENRRLIYAYNYTYNKKGLLVEARLSCCDKVRREFFSTLVGFQYEYDQHFNITKSIEYTPDLKQKRTHYYTYAKGKVVKDSLVTYFYDLTFKRSKKMSIEDQNYVRIMKYDDLGNLTWESTQYEFSKPKKEYFTYRYDEHDNWIERVRFCGDGTAVQLSKRTFIYY